MIKNTLATMLIALSAANCYAVTEPSPPSGDEGTAVTFRGMACRVSIPHPNQPIRVARKSARMSAWIGEQKPTDIGRTRVWIHREGDEHVFLRGPAFPILNMGTVPVVIYQRDNEETPIGVIDHTNDSHWIPINTPLAANIAAYTNGVPDAEVAMMQFKVENARPSKKFGESTHENADSYTVTVLFLNLLGQVRAFGICM